ncbi:hypothetical protein [Streptomyces noursei]|uniref:hypothetical protein n=1 Tax=Streptomyces noursei TaxID=1971 RepID=UPI00045EDFA6|nr:hypothetical protein [Streptomyces noursei]AIA07171.1 hypothetical protein DC74_6739 [Streptomyces noursei]
MTQPPTALADATTPRRRARAVAVARRPARDTARPRGRQPAALPLEAPGSVHGRRQRAGATVREGFRAPWTPYGTDGFVREHGARQPPPADVPRSPRAGARGGRIAAHRAAAATVRTVQPIDPDPAELTETVEHRR